MARLAALMHGNEERIGIVDGETLGLLPPLFKDLTTVVQSGHEAVEKLLAAPIEAEIELAAAQLLAPVRRFRRDVLCTGWNYWDHFEEGRGRREGQDVDPPEHPTFFTKAPDVVIGPKDPIAYDPQISQKWDYEAEIALVFGKDGRCIPEERAHEYILGYCLANDVSQRDLQRAHGGQWLKGKSIDGTMPLGPWITLARDLDISDVVIECFVNGERMQSASTSQMAFSIPRLIAELSWGMTIHAGDVLLTGTPAGVGNARTPQLFLKQGDEVIVRSEPLGELRNRFETVDLHSPR
ncbi:MAG: fumarylacetoacetate hydrolase family protein [Tepidamorphaceae bacterium]